MIVAIHQPNFLPWLPFFEKVRSADVFVILSHCQYEKNNFQNRFHYRNNWHTMSTNKGLEPIIKKRYTNHQKDWNKIKENLKDRKYLLDQFDDCICDNLFETNQKIILKVMHQLNIKTVVEFDKPASLLSTERLVKICQDLGATTYLSGAGGRNYMDIRKFTDVGINVMFQETEVKDRVHVLDILGEK